MISTAMGAYAYALQSSRAATIVRVDKGKFTRLHKITQRGNLILVQVNHKAAIGVCLYTR